MLASEENLDQEPRFSNSGLLRQIASCLILSLGPFSFGLSCGWISPMSLILMGPNSPVGRRLTENEIALLAALPSYLVFITVPAFTFIQNNYGRKPGLQIVGILSIASAVATTLSTTPSWLYVGRLLSGFSTFSMVISPMYVAEIAQHSVRGVLTSFCNIQINFGIVVSFIIGGSLSYEQYNIILIAAPVLFLLLLAPLPESPQFLNSRSRRYDALKAILWYRNYNRLAAEGELRSIDSFTDSHQTNFIEVFNNRATRKALFITMTLSVLQTSSGIQICMNYDDLIYEETGTPMSLNGSSIIMALLVLFGSIIGIFFVDVVGRKPLLCGSFGLCAITMGALALQLARTSKRSWIPFACINMFVFSYGLGLNFIPGLLSTELTPPKTRPAVFGVNAVLVIIIQICVVQSFPVLEANFGLSWIFGMFAVVNAIGLVICWLLLPETLGKSMNQIIDELTN